ncbi:transmembrane protein 241 [Nematostella vectensis]|uniref:transmembrane protein 241 n=1 Tax=Nematostella vectensis TaxID=45351 RepID=UPI002077073B|nr:transmembrane protein 241 [Nematostella vectensis]
MPTWRTRSVVAGFCVLMVITTLTNKYVLSILKFTYPTIFQSWQSGTMAVVLLSLHVLGYINLDLSVNRDILISWFPGTVFFSGAIYAGSIALSRLSVPVFCALQYGSFVVMTLVDWLVFNRIEQFSKLAWLLLSAVAVVGVVQTDPKYDQMGYRWMLVHCTFTGAYLAFEKSKKSLQLSDLNKIFYNTFSSVVLLMGISIGGGELYKVIEFPFLYTREFHIGCIISGIFGAVVGLLGTNLSNTEVGPSQPLISSIIKVAVAVTSLAFYKASYTLNLGLFIILGLASGVMYSYSPDLTVSNGDKMREAQI